VPKNAGVVDFIGTAMSSLCCCDGVAVEENQQNREARGSMLRKRKITMPFAQGVLRMHAKVIKSSAVGLGGKRTVVEV
jgi:hypothetical protein